MIAFLYGMDNKIKKKRALILYHANLSSKPQHVQHKVQLNYYLSKMCISWSYTKNYGKQKILYVQRRRFRSHSHRPRDQSVATEQPLVSRKKFVFSNQLLVGGEAVGCRWVKLVTKTYTDG